jgi:hypothetical protein
VGVQIERETHLGVRLGECFVIPLYQFQGRYTLLTGGEHRRSAVHVTSGHHQDVVTYDPVKSRKNIRWQRIASDMSKMR